MVWSNDTKAIVEIILGIIIAFINLCEAIYLSAYKKRRSIYETILLSLSIADLLFGLSNFSIGVAFFTSNIHEEVFEITTTTYFFFILTSLLHLCWITIDRLWAVYSPLKHNYTITKTKVNILLVLTWISTTFVSLFLIMHDEFVVEKGKVKQIENITAHISRYQETMETTLSSFVVVINAVFIVSYSILSYVLLNGGSKKKLKTTDDSKRLQAERKVVITCLLISASFVCFTLPFAITVFVRGKSNQATALLLQLNSGMNSIIYFLRNKVSFRGKQNPQQTFATTITPLSTPVLPHKTKPEDVHMIRLAIDNSRR